jgi:hypothetical protein
MLDNGMIKVRQDAPVLDKMLDKVLDKALPDILLVSPPIRKSGPKFDKKGYQREYMRRRRAAEKAKP